MERRKPCLTKRATGINPWYWKVFFPQVTVDLISNRHYPYPFQPAVLLAHVVVKTSFDAVSTDKRLIESEWAVHEVKATADFAAQNKIISWLVGALNFQIEHHLFPHISRVGYLTISKIVKHQCELFGLPYNYYPSMT